jgi:hypothetical protein
VFDYPLAHEDVVNTFLHHNPVGHPTVLFRRAAILEVGNYDPAMAWEDYDLWLRLAQRYRLANLPEYLVNYRLHPQSISLQQQKAKQMEHLMERIFTSQVSVLFGLTPAEAGRLHAKRDSLVIARAWKMARHLARTQGGTTWARMRNPSLINQLRPMTRSGDLISRFGFALLPCKQSSGARRASFVEANV